MKIPTLTAFLCISIIIAGCGPTYPKEEVAQSIIALCKKEAGIDVDVKILGKTVIVHFDSDNIISTSYKLTPEIGEKLEDVALIMRRVALSSDMDMEFYTIIANDPFVTGIEFILTCYVTDTKRLKALNISRGEYMQRVLKDMWFNPQLLGEITVKNLFRDMSSQGAVAVIDTYFQPGIELKTMSPDLFNLLTSSTNTDSRHFEIQRLESKRTSQNQALIYCSVREKYTNFENEYLISIDTSLYPYCIKQIVPQYFQDETGATRKRFPFGTHLKFENYPAWDKDPLNTELDLPHFLLEQTARRMRTALEEEGIRLNFISGNIEIPDGDMTMRRFSFVCSAQKETSSSQDVSSILLGVIASVMHGYDFEDYSEVKMLNIGDRRPVVLDRPTLELFRRGKITIEEIH